MYSAKDLVRIFQSYFPSLVIEKWLPGGTKVSGVKRSPGAIRIMTTDKKWYIFEFNSENDWSLRSCGYRIKE